MSLPPSTAGQWDGLQSGSVQRALRRGLLDDGVLSHEEVVDIVRSTLSNGIVSASELHDLALVAAKSKSISPRSRKMLQTVVDRLKTYHGPYYLTSPRQMFAAEMVCDFLNRSGRSHFPKLDRDEIGVGMLMRIANPGILRQGEASLCGPTALMFSKISDNPGEYVRFAVDLYEKGQAKLGRLVIEPGKDVRSYLPPTYAIDQVDWLTMASIRDSENWLLDYDNADKEFAGITLPGELAHWFRLAGYSDVREETNLYFNKGTGTIDDANKLFAQGYRICVFINAQMLDAKEQTETSTIPNHWVVLQSAIARSGDKVSLEVFTWGEGKYRIPHSGDLTVHDFLNNFYGYVAGKP